MGLRGDVVSVINVRKVLRMPEAEMTRQWRNVIVNSGEESTGLIVDSVADVVRANVD